MPDPARTRADYLPLLQEVRKYQGVSLAHDAWRRLRRNRLAMASLWFLLVIALGAFLTPFWPLQSPRQQWLGTAADPGSSRQFRGPEFWPLFRVDEKLKLQERATAVTAAQTKGDADSEERADEAYRQRIDALFGCHNPLDVALVRARVACFGDYVFCSVCGTDELGRDLLARLCWGSRVSIMVGLVATLVSLVIGVTYGAIAGYLGGLVDDLMMRLVDVLYSIPFIFLVIFLITILNEESIARSLREFALFGQPFPIDRIMIFFFVIGAVYWLTMARVVRGQILSLKQEPFIEAARTVGASRTRIIFKHLIPNVMSIVIVYLTLTIPQVMLFEAFLSFLGLGVEAPDVSWGLLANDGVRAISPLRIYWWLVLFPGAVMALTLFALNFLGDGLRDALDPRLKNR